MFVGRTAELIKFGDSSTGAANDIECAPSSKAASRQRSRFSTKTGHCWTK
ncbi:hypothetical protein LJC56_08255 [Christensenellaceae bacterium OttesenSCG-928-K19]|nr:hypothetical protein [Christensenellaceae bacterium OttesenSCG-928-K19]